MSTRLRLYSKRNSRLAFLLRRGGGTERRVLTYKRLLKENPTMKECIPSRRDQMKVAGHEVPGNKRKADPSRTVDLLTSLSLCELFGIEFCAIFGMVAQASPFR